MERWSAILRLAHLWNFPKVKELAVQEMDKLRIAPVKKVLMARKYEVDPKYQWLEKAFTALGVRDAPISKAEGEKLGLDDVVLLAELRERIRKRRSEGRGTSTYDDESEVQDEEPPVIHSTEPYPSYSPNNYNCYNGYNSYNPATNYLGTTAPVNQRPGIASGWGMPGTGCRWPSYTAPIRVPTPPSPPQPTMMYGRTPAYVPPPPTAPAIPPPPRATVIVQPPSKMDEGNTVAMRNFGGITIVAEEPDVIDSSSYTDDDVADVRSVFGL